MANVDLTVDCGLQGFDFDPRNNQFQYTPRLSWPLSTEHAPHPNPPRRSTTPLQSDNNAMNNFDAASQQAQSSMMRDWQFSQGPAQSNLGYAMDAPAAFPSQGFEAYGASYQSSPTDYVPSQDDLNHNFQMDGSYLALQNQIDGMPFNWQDFNSNDLLGFPNTNALPDLNSQTLSDNSPSDTYLEVRSLTSSSSNDGWASVDYTRQGAIFNPGQTLHPRTFSDSSYSDLEQQSRQSWGSYVEVPNAINSPGTDSVVDLDFSSDGGYRHGSERPGPSNVVTTALVQPIAIKTSSSPQRSPTVTSQDSPPSSSGRRARKLSTVKTSKAVIRRTSQSTKNDLEKRVGRRKGPLRPDQRKQASEIRKLGACLRCRFLKKTCDKGEPCGGCQPSHARLWQVPCTRIDIKDIAFFMKDWKADYERHVSLGISVGNIKGFADKETTLFITHGYGHVLPVKAREVFVRDERCFGMDWVETITHEPQEHGVNTAKMSAGAEGISTALLSDYLDRHLDGGFESFVDEYFEGTPFITQMLKTAFRFWNREKTPVIKKALKLVLAYNLTQHITMLEGIPEEEGFLGKVTDKDSKWFGKIVAPVMISFQIKCALADMWRELQKDILEELSSLYSSVYTRDKLKHWPTIFMLASILLSVWEEMQFDCHYKVPVSVVIFS